MPDLTTNPLVSCIMPTYNRREFIPHAIRYFLRQNYQNKELIIIDDGEDKINDLIPDLPFIQYYQLPKKITLGAKLNLACRYAKGNIIANWDDDDWYADWRLGYQVNSLLSTGKQVCGINKLLYFDLGSKDAFQYVYPSNQRVWLLGSSLCFTKELWNKNSFKDIDVGMDGIFVWNTPAEKVMVLPDHSFSVHMIHKNNVSPKNTSGSWWHSYAADDIKNIMADDWQYYANGHIRYPQLTDHNLLLAHHKKEPEPIKNVFACLVHEQPDCIIDLVENLHYADPSSTILLYNGSANEHLIPPDFPFQQYNTVIHPSPAPIKHGYLHAFALKCMQFALNELDADILTIVDSDQLSVREDYSGFMSGFLANRQGIGMLSSNPEHVGRDHKTNHVALQAFREYDLWKPLLEQFAKGEENFVYWTFWPSTVFTKDAMQDVLKLFDTNIILQDIMRKTQIWASEEVILPTLVKLLGYDILANPCSYELVRYRQPLHSDELRKAFQKNDVYWVHPVTRSSTDTIRKLIRTKFNEYEQETKPLEIPHTFQHTDYNIAALLQKIKTIEGWLSDNEAKLLVNTCLQVMNNLPRSGYIVEVGSYHGKATVLLGTVIKELFPDARMASIDPHDGKQGAVDQGLKKFPPSFTSFKKNIEDAGLTEIVEIVQDHSCNVQWQKPVSLLVIDGLHDYKSVSSDFNHFASWLVKGSYVAFHDYADYFPGVKKYVNELMKSGEYQKAAKEDNMIVLMKL